MKHILSLALLISTQAFAQNDQRKMLEDLRVMNLNVDAQSTEGYEIHYPNYRMGGGVGPRRSLRDCLLLDIRNSDVIVPHSQKLKFAQALKMEFGFRDDLSPMKLEVRGHQIMFYHTERLFYMLDLKASAPEGETLNGLITKLLPKSQDNVAVPRVGLIYVRDCRL